MGVSKFLSVHNAKTQRGTSNDSALFFAMLKIRLAAHQQQAGGLDDFVVLDEGEGCVSELTLMRFA